VPVFSSLSCFHLSGRWLHKMGNFCLWCTYRLAFLFAFILPWEYRWIYVYP
jgi:hypothetical protein